MSTTNDPEGQGAPAIEATARRIEEGEATAKPARSGSLLSSLFRIGLVVLGAVIGAALVKYALPDTLATGGTSERMAAIETALAAVDAETLRTRIKTVEDRVKALPPAEIAELKSRLDAAADLTVRLDERLAAMEAQAGASTAPAGDTGLPAMSPTTGLSQELLAEIGQIKARIDLLAATDAEANRALTGRLVSLEAAAEAYAERAAIDALLARMDALESNSLADEARRLAAGIAFANLARAAESGAPFTRELALVRDLEADAAKTATIAPYAEAGVRPAAALLDDLPLLAREAVRADLGAGAGWLSRLWANIQGLFLVRRTGPVDGDTTEAIVARAEHAAAKGDLALTIRELSSLQGRPGEVAQAWLREARARASLNEVLGTLAADLPRQIPD